MIHGGSLHLNINNNRSFTAFILGGSLIAVSLPLLFSLFGINLIVKEWSLISIVIISIAVILIIRGLKKNILTTKEVALITVLGTVTAVLRIPFTFLPNIQPCTFLIICIGLTFGSSIGFLVGILTPLISNFFLGHGPWTPIQMYAWGLIGGLSGLFIFNPTINRWKLGLIGIFAGYLFGFIMNIWFWYSFLYPLTLSTFLVAEMQGIIFDTLHAIGNFAFLVLLGNKTLKVLNSFKEKKLY
jgi:energy-coupling factor transport system substrate-specific component